MSVERAFTLVELVVGMLLLGLLLVVAGRPLVDGFVGAATTQSSTVSFQEVQDATEQIRDDVARAYTPGRGSDLVRDRDTLAAALNADPGEVRSDMDPSIRLDVRDVIIAEPYRVAFIADVSAKTAGAECVMWVMRNIDGVSLLRRDVHAPGSNCASDASILRRKDMLEHPSPRSYHFDYSGSPRDLDGAVFTYTKLGAPIGHERSCTFEHRSFLGGTGMNRITAMHIHVSTAALRGSGAASDANFVVAPLTSRDAPEYTSALGCTRTQPDME